MRCVVALVAALLSVWNPPTLVGPHLVPAAPTTYTYDAPGYDAPENDVARERGPPVMGQVNITRGAVDLRSYGASARADRTVTPVVTTYAYPGTPLQVALPTTATDARAGATDREFLLVSGPPKSGPFRV